MLRLFQRCLYPKFCRSCGQLTSEQSVFCRPCLGSIKILPSAVYPITSAYDLKVFAAAAYQDPIKNLVTRKFYGDLVASRQLAQMILQFTEIHNTKIDCLTYIPLHWQRYAWRGFNQSHEMAKELGKQLQVPVAGLVRRCRKTEFQWKMSGGGRRQNVEGAFDASWYSWLKGNDLIKGKHIVIVDDLCTTGSTLVLTAKIIAHQRPASITAFVGCRVV